MRLVIEAKGRYLEVCIFCHFWPIGQYPKLEFHPDVEVFKKRVICMRDVIFHSGTMFLNRNHFHR